MALSSEVSAEDPIVYTQYNNLRSDVLSPTVGHDHSGSSDTGKKISVADMFNVGPNATGALSGELVVEDRVRRYGDNARGVMAVGSYGDLLLNLKTIDGSRVIPNAEADYEETHNFTFDTAYSSLPNVTITICSTSAYIERVEYVWLENLTVSGGTVRFQWHSAGGSTGQTATWKVMVQAFGT